MKPFVFLNILKFECTVGHRKKITISKFEFNIITNNTTISSMIIVEDFQIVLLTNFVEKFYQGDETNNQFFCVELVFQTHEYKGHLLLDGHMCIGV